MMVFESEIFVDRQRPLNNWRICSGLVELIVFIKHKRISTGFRHYRGFLEPTRKKVVMNHVSGCSQSTPHAQVLYKCHP